MGEGTEQSYFFTKDRVKLKNILELKNYLDNTTNDLFRSHVNPEKNDFEFWISDSLHEYRLADEIRNIKTKEEIIKHLNNHLSRSLSKTNAEASSQTSKTPQSPETPAQSQALNPVKTGHAQNTQTALSRIKAASKTATATATAAAPSLRPNAEEDEDEIPPVEWIKTHIAGFDQLLTNGIPKGSAILICGGPGTAKTTFCLQTISQASSKGEKCLYLTFEEDETSLKQHMKSYGWNPTKLEREGNLIIRKMQPFELSRSVEALLARASGELTIELDEIEGVIPRGFKPDRIILDSLSAVAAAFGGKDEGYRIYIEQLFNLFKKVGATSFLISEIEQDTNKYSRSGVEEFLADAVFVFYNIRKKSVRLNALEVLKIRGTSHQKKIVPFKLISNKGITVYPQEEVFT